MQTATRTFDTALGPMTATFGDDRLTALGFVDPSESNGATAGAANDAADRLVAELEEYFARDRKTFSIPCAPAGTPFQQRVWEVLATIPFGSTITYDAITQQLGDPKAIRAVGGAVGANPIAILVPCHRVIGSDGSLTGYAGGIERKRRLLAIEGAVPGDLWEDLEWSLEEARSRRPG